MRCYQNAALRAHGGQDMAFVRALQRDLRALGYLRDTIDGIFGGGTEQAVRSLQFDLLNHVGGNGAPLAIQNYAKGRISAVTGVVEVGLAACIDDMVNDLTFVKVPSSPNPAAENARALAAIAAMENVAVPKPFLLAILGQESNCRHFAVPAGPNEDNFVTLGLDRNDEAKPDHVTSRGYGIGQYTLFHHPLTQVEMQKYVLDPVANVQNAIAELLEKYNGFITGSTADTTADDRIAEVDHGGMPRQPLRDCRYKDPTARAKYMTDCRACMQSAGTTTIRSGDPVYEGTSLRYAPTQYHPEEVYQGVPIRKNIPCDWPYAARRYNGSGVNSYHYQTQVLLRVLRGE